MEGRRRLRRRWLLAVLAAVLCAPLHTASARQPPEPPTIVIEAEDALVGRALSVDSGAAASGGEFVHFDGPAGPPPTQGVRVAGNRLRRDGAPFVPVGFTMVALVHPAGAGETTWAAGRLNDTAMETAKAWGANTIRFQLSQRGLDPTDPLYSRAYLQRILAGVTLARAHGLVVILSIQDQKPSGGDSHAQPSGATILDWKTLTALFNGDQNVIYEIFNEPQNRPTPDGWSVWRNGGPPERNQGTPAVGHQRVLNEIRATGATNVVIAEAGQFGQRLDGIPLLHDPLGQVAYGVHPYLTHTLREPDDWQPGFGFLASQYPVVATEWVANSKVRFCKPEWETTSPQLMTFLQERNIGVMGWALDVINSLIADWRFTPTSLEGFQCGPEHEHGAGELLKSRMAGWHPRVSPCDTGLSDEGVVAIPVDVPMTGEYRLWSRVMKAKSGTGSGIALLQVDDNCPVPAWEERDPDGEWSWDTSDGAWLELEQGRHTLRILGAPGGVNLDRVVLTADVDCVPGFRAHSCEEGGQRQVPTEGIGGVYPSEPWRPAVPDAERHCRPTRPNAPRAPTARSKTSSSSKRKHPERPHPSRSDHPRCHESSPRSRS